MIALQDWERQLPPFAVKDDSSDDGKVGHDWSRNFPGFPFFACGH